jgi:hypothetical protein
MKGTKAEAVSLLICRWTFTSPIFRSNGRRLFLNHWNQSRFIFGFWFQGLICLQIFFLELHNGFGSFQEILGKSLRPISFYPQRLKWAGVVRSRTSFDRRQSPMAAGASQHQLSTLRTPAGIGYRGLEPSLKERLTRHHRKNLAATTMKNQRMKMEGCICRS